jgi:hypothetical protein
MLLREAIEARLRIVGVDGAEAEAAAAARMSRDARRESVGRDDGESLLVLRESVRRELARRSGGSGSDIMGG